MQKKNRPEVSNAIADKAQDNRATPQAAPVQSPPPADANSLGQVRDILLGPLSQSFEQTLKKIEQRVQDMEKRFDKMMREHGERASARFEAMEKRTDERISAMSEDVKRDRNRHSKASEQVKQDCDTALSAARKKLEDLFKQHEKDQAKQAETTRTKLAELSASLDTETSQLRGELVDRASLASALSEVALRLSGTPQGMVMDSGAADPEIDAALANLE